MTQIISDREWTVRIQQVEKKFGRALKALADENYHPATNKEVKKIFENLKGRYKNSTKI